jgi:hypothetical protein
MRSWGVLAVAAVVCGVAACATGTDGLDLSSGGNVVDAGGTPDAAAPHDSATGLPPQDSSVPDMDSATPPDMDSSVPDMDSSMPPPNDASPPPVDSSTGAFCSTSNSTQNAIYGAEYAAALTGNPVFCDMTTGSGCTATQCCFIPSFGLPACVTK